MGKWEFNIANARGVQQEITQADQFNNDDVELAEALVREAVQNSTDARSTGAAGPVKVRFGIKSLNHEDSAKLRSQTADIIPHLKASDFDTRPLGENARVLTIEDFSTSGLTGSVAERGDKGHFELFWRTMGGSGKTGKHGGRWGLGKFTYAMSSKARVFYGLTVREEESQPYLMGQAVLRFHEVQGQRYEPHGFWCKGIGGSHDIEIPIDDNAEIAEFRQLMGVSRTEQSGLSVVIPYLRDDINEEKIITALMSNYFFPILSGNLVAEVGETIVSADTFVELAKEYGDRLPSSLPVKFVKAVSDRLNQSPDFEIQQAANEEAITEESFSSDGLMTLRQKFRDGDNIHIRVPLSLTKHDGAQVETHVDAFIESLGSQETPYVLIARNSILLKSEQRHFGARQAHAALVSTDDPLTEFLGDAENPAHTQWTYHAEKANRNWKHVAQNIKTIRNILPTLHNIIAEQEEEEDEDLLLDFFSIVEQARKSAGKKPKTPKPKPDVEPTKKAILIRKSGSGFEIKNGPGTEDWEFPRRIRIRVAYDLIGANPFKSHNKFDFDLQKAGAISWEVENGQLTVLDKNIAAFDVEGEDFVLKFAGFDVNRDLIVDARAV